MGSPVPLVKQHVALIQTFAVIAEDGDPVDDRVRKVVTSACNHFRTAHDQNPDVLLAIFREELASLDTALVAEVDALLEVKMRAGEAATSPRWAGIHDFIERELAVAEAHAFDRQPKASTRPLDDFLHDAVLHFGARRDD